MSVVLGSVAWVTSLLFFPGCTKQDAPSASTAATGKDAKPVETEATKKAAEKAAADKEKDKARQAAAEAVPVETAPATRGAISAFLTFNSTLETEATVDLFPQASGQVEALLAEEGKIVKEGEALLKIEDRELRVDVEESSTNYTHLEQGFTRLDDLYKRSLINKQEYEDAKFQLDQARLRLDRAKLKLEYATVRAPFDGVVSSRDTQVGARVGPGTKVFSMVKLDEIVARVFVPGRYLSVVAENQVALVTSEFLPDRTFKGWVKRISPVIDPKSGTFKVTIGVRGEKPSELPPGLFVGVRVVTDTRPAALLIPKRAVVYEGGERYIFSVDKDNKATKRKLVAGYEDPVNIEVMSGFDVGTNVIVLGHAGLKDGAMVRPVNLPSVAAPDAPKADAPIKATASAGETTKTGE
jgi:membrane fusion protein (multidrug efflux system)